MYSILCYKFINVDDTITPSEFSQFCTETKKILDNKKTWSSFLVNSENGEFYAEPIKLICCNTTEHACSGFRIVNNRIKKINAPHVLISLATDNYINSVACPGLESETNTKKFPLSCTLFVDKKYHIFINKLNWDNGFKLALSSDGYMNCDKNACKIAKVIPLQYNCFVSNPELIVDLYREYVINHEMGHALGRGHFIPKYADENKNKFLPIMAQQTKGFFNYKINTWPLEIENCIVAENEKKETIAKFIIGL